MVNNLINSEKMFKRLSLAENEAILDLPVYVSLLAANGDGMLDKPESDAASKFAHTSTFSGDPVLIQFYRESNRVFGDRLVRIDRLLPKGKDLREQVIKRRLGNLENLILKLSARHIAAMNRGMRSLKMRVSKAHHSIVVDFILPLPIPGLTE
jgi:hypothetical protein